MPIALESEDAEGQSAEEREEALNQEVTRRMEEIEKQANYLQMLH
jgi:hypothetical protein